MIISQTASSQRHNRHIGVGDEEEACEPAVRPVPAGGAGLGRSVASVGTSTQHQSWTLYWTSSAVSVMQEVKASLLCDQLQRSSRTEVECGQRLQRPGATLRCVPLGRPGFRPTHTRPALRCKQSWIWFVETCKEVLERAAGHADLKLVAC